MGLPFYTRAERPPAIEEFVKHRHALCVGSRFRVAFVDGWYCVLEKTNRGAGWTVCEFIRGGHR